MVSYAEWVLEELLEVDDALSVELDAEAVAVALLDVVEAEESELVEDEEVLDAKGDEVVLAEAETEPVLEANEEDAVDEAGAVAVTIV